MTNDEFRTIFDPKHRRQAFNKWKASLSQCGCYFENTSECAGVRKNVYPMTAYGDEPQHYRMCKLHADEYQEFWNEMWSEYYDGLL